MSNLDVSAQATVRILVVDDLVSQHVVLRTVLEEPGQDVVCVASGREALKEVLKQDFAVILLDVNMPDMDGFETASLLRSYRRTASTPIIFVTAHVDDAEMARGYSLGAVDYISSPVVPEILRAKVRVFVQLYRMNAELVSRAAQREALARAAVHQRSGGTAAYRRPRPRVAIDHQHHARDVRQRGHGRIENACRRRLHVERTRQQVAHV